jgi:hypothetical protein
MNSDDIASNNVPHEGSSPRKKFWAEGHFFEVVKGTQNPA